MNSPHEENSCDWRQDAYVGQPLYDFFDDSEARKALIVVAHADDETIFMGGTILKHTHWDWRLFCLAFRYNDREGDLEQLHRVLEIYGKYGVDITFCEGMRVKDEDELDKVKLQEEEIRNSIGELDVNLTREKWNPDILFTHNEHGEYGHEQHKCVHRFVKNKFQGVDIWEFISPGATNVVPQPFRSEVVIQKLSQDELRQKRDIYSLYKTEQGNWVNHLAPIMAYQFGTGPEIFTKG